MLTTLLGLLLIACEPTKTDVDGVTPLPEDEDTGGNTDDTGVPDDTGAPDGDWTAGPALPDCTPQEGSGTRVALSGVLLGLDGPEAGVVIYDQATGLITCSGTSCDTTDARIVCTEGVISPGLIDTHNHLQYNVIPPWKHGALYSDRYDWQSDGDYWDYREAYDEIEDDYTCEIMKWAELRDLVGGATAAVGATGGSCIDTLVRDLDEDYNGFSNYDLYYSSSKVMSAYDEGDGSSYSSRLDSGSLDAVLNHVGEGIGGSVKAEIDHMFDIGMSGPGEDWIHASDATTEQLAKMAETGTTIIWSPRSNLDLYGDTTNADVAMRMGVPVALGPDWTWSGSFNVPRELQCAWDFLGTRDRSLSDADLFALVTTEGARAVGLDGIMGALEPGMVADISVYTFSREPYRSVIEASSEDVLLVVLGGDALFGTPELVDPLATTPEWCETVTPCTQTRTLCVQSASSGDDAQTYGDLESILSGSLGAVHMPAGLEYAGELSGLWMCEDERDSCAVGTPTDDDTDGDGILDSDDLCPTAWDPLQADHDGDGVGDVCDPCPLNPVSDTCTHDPEDIDGDGLRGDDDLCPYLYGPDEVDSDGDGSGDSCDRCPDYANPDDGACPMTIRQVRDRADPDAVGEGEAVAFSGVVVTGVRDGSGYYVQDPDEAEYGGIFVYDGGDAAVQVGDQVSVSGTYQEYYDLSEITSVTTTITGTATVPAPLVATSCDVGTGGSLAEPYESMLIQVQDVTVTDSNPDDPNDYGEFEVDGCLRVDDAIYDGLVPQPAVDTTFTSLTGVLNYGYSNTKLLVRSAEDVVE